MNSSELLSALNKQSQNKHHPKNKSAILDTIPEKHEPAEQKENQFSSIKLPDQTPPPPEFLQQILADQKQSKLVNSSIQQAISKVRKQRQKNVFLVFNQSHIAYLSELQALAAVKNEYASKSISDVMLRRFNIVSTDLENGRLLVNRDRSISTKEQVEQYADLDRARLLKIKEGAIRSKLDLLNSKMEEMQKIYQSPKNQDSMEEINKKIEENLNSAGYGLESEKTKIAKDYVKYMSEQRKERRKRQQLREQRRLKYEGERQAQLKQAEQMRDLAKKQEILVRIQQKRKKRDEEEKAIAEKQDNIDKFLQKYRQEMPIFKKKEKQFEQKFVKPEKMYRQEKLKEIKEKKKSYSLNDIVDHEKKYEELKRKETDRKINEKQMYLKSLKINTKQHYKGSAHKIVEEIDKANRQKNIALYQLGRNRKQRMIDYAKGIKEEHQPKIDENKRSQLLKLLEKEYLKNNKIVKKYRPLLNSDGEDAGTQSFYEQKANVDRYKEGNKFMQQGNSKRKKNVSQSMDVSLESSQKSEQKLESLKLLKKKSDAVREKENTEKQIWKLRSRQLAEMSVNLSSPKQFEQMKANFENMDKKAADKEAIMKHTKMNVEQFIEQKGALDQFYLESIKNKIRLLE